MHATCERKRLLRDRVSAAQSSTCRAGRIAQHTVHARGSRNEWLWHRFSAAHFSICSAGRVAQHLMHARRQRKRWLQCCFSAAQSRFYRSNNRASLYRFSAAQYRICSAAARLLMYFLALQARSPASGCRQCFSGIVSRLSLSGSRVNLPGKQVSLKLKALAPRSTNRPATGKSCRPPCHLTAKGPELSLRCHRPFALHHSRTTLIVKGYLQVLSVSSRAALAARSMHRVAVLHTVQVCASHTMFSCASCCRMPSRGSAVARGHPGNVPLLVAHHRRCPRSGTW